MLKLHEMVKADLDRCINTDTECRFTHDAYN